MIIPSVKIADEKGLPYTHGERVWCANGEVAGESSMGFKNRYFDVLYRTEISSIELWKDILNNGIYSNNRR